MLEFIYNTVGLIGFLFPLMVLLVFIFLPDYCSNWLVENDFFVKRKIVHLRVFIVSVKMYFNNTVRADLFTNTLEIDLIYDCRT